MLPVPEAQNNSAEKSYRFKTGDEWSYRETPDKTQKVLLLFSVCVFGISAFLAGHDRSALLPLFLLLITLGVLAVRVFRRFSSVVVSRSGATVVRTDRGLFSKTSMYSLNDFDTVSLIEDTKAVQEGYFMAEYSLVLRGTDHSLVILSTDDRQEALALQADLSQFLARDCNSESQRETRSAMVQ